MKKYQIIKHSKATEQPSGIKSLIVELSELTYFGNSVNYPIFNQQGTEFIFLLESPAAQDILNQVITDPLELDLNNFEFSELEIGNNDPIDVYMHKDYIQKRKKHEHPYISYEKIYNLNREELSEIPLLLYEHLYRYVLENAPMETMDVFYSIAYAKRMVPQALINTTSFIIN